ncbi:F-box domain-containing protein [Mycena chlorophos]|uniref:F-box domain-containing protein n=1 Tax=Mycena chlorophos TaxID=658473 RepID=A0A8H6SAG8_MYCCL|nr:F-box domain-containing protein [Mycena chlorophos]
MPLYSILRLSGHGVDFTEATRRDLATQLRVALPHMKLLETFRVYHNVNGGVWSELLDAFCAAHAPFTLVLEAPWLFDHEPPSPKATTLPLKGLEYAFPLMYDDVEDVTVRRDSYIVKHETLILRSILLASASTLESLVLPGELFRVLEGTTWNALTYLHLTGFWPLLDDIDDSDSEEPSFAADLLTDDVATSIGDDAGALPSTLTPSDPPAAQGTSASDSRPAVPSEPHEHSDAARPVEDIPTAEGKSAPLPETSSSSSAPSPTSPIPLPVVLPSTQPEGKTSPRGSRPQTPEPTSTKPLVAVGAATDNPVPAEVSPPAIIGADAQFPSPGNPTAERERSPLLAILEAMPNLQSLDFELRHHLRDETPLGGIICTLDGPSSPKDPDTFLRHLVLFQATSLSSDDRTVHFLPSHLRTCSLIMYPRVPESHTVLVEPTVEAVLESVQRASFSELTTLKLWWVIDKRQDLEREETLLELLPKKFPLVEQFELCRGFNHAADSLRNLWDPIPLLKRLVSQMKHLKIVAFAINPPERFRKAPFFVASRDFRELMVRVYDMALEIVRAAPWIKEIQMYRELGRDPEAYWEAWKVFAVPGQDVRFNRPPPLISDSHPFYPDPYIPLELLDPADPSEDEAEPL